MVENELVHLQPREHIVFILVKLREAVRDPFVVEDELDLGDVRVVVLEHLRVELNAVVLLHVLDRNLNGGTHLLEQILGLALRVYVCRARGIPVALLVAA